ncbi:unnamed protein product [Leptosia nina]|uniref:Gustatory receptor n=1 Tax=Leptosia nina TaxID=320188 RepID=A0AAV1IWU2_9NEOP
MVFDNAEGFRGAFKTIALLGRPLGIFPFTTTPQLQVSKYWNIYGIFFVLPFLRFVLSRWVFVIPYVIGVSCDNFLFILLTIRIHSATVAMNQELKKLFSNMDPNDENRVKKLKILRNNYLVEPTTKTVTTNEGVLHKIRELSEAYTTISDMIKIATESAEVAILIDTVGMLVRLMCRSYKLAKAYDFLDARNSGFDSKNEAQISQPHRYCERVESLLLCHHAQPNNIFAPKCMYFGSRISCKAPSDSDIPNKIRELTVSYTLTADAVTIVTDTFEIRIVIDLLWIVMHLMSTIYILVNEFGKGEQQYNVALGVARKIYWFVIISMRIICLCEVPHRISSAMSETQELLTKLKRKFHDMYEIRNELDLFFRTTQLNNTTFSPLSVCTLNRDLIATILGCAATYLIAIIQLVSTK